MSTLADLAVDSIVCPHCAARPGEECETTTGHRAAVHVARWEPLGIAFGMGYDEGRP